MTVRNGCDKIFGNYGKDIRTPYLASVLFLYCWLLICLVCWSNTFVTGLFFYQGFLWQILAIHGTAGERRGPSFFVSTTPTPSQTFRHLFATLDVRWLPRTFNLITCHYQSATRGDLRFWGIPLEWSMTEC